MVPGPFVRAYFSHSFVAFSHTAGEEEEGLAVLSHKNAYMLDCAGEL